MNLVRAQITGTRNCVSASRRMNTRRNQASGQLAGLRPGNRESGGKQFSGRTRKANRYVKPALCQAAWAASHTNNTYLPAFYRRRSIRKGAPERHGVGRHMTTVPPRVAPRPPPLDTHAPVMLKI
ncbi:MAG TPA: transposase [Bryobacteraceae bacterium]|nr:transposase [Bryobacteraceae bacterium]